MPATIRKSRKAQELLDRLCTERTRLLGELAGIERAISFAQGESEQVETTAPARGSAKALLIDLLREVKEEGLNATLAEEMAAARGKVLKRGTAASNLSRMKADNIITHDGDKYRLPEFTRQPSLAVMAGGKGS